MVGGGKPAMSDPLQNPGNPTNFRPDTKIHILLIDAPLPSR